MADAVSRLAANRQATQPQGLPAFGPTGNAALDGVLSRWREMASVQLFKDATALALAPDFPLRRSVSSFTGTQYLSSGFFAVTHNLSTVNLVGAVFKTHDSTGTALATQPQVGSTVSVFPANVDAARITLSALPSANEIYRVVLIG